MKRMMLIFAFALVHGSLWSQFSFSGVITGEGNEPLAGANVSILQTFRGAVTGNDGAFLIRGLKAGTYQVKISFIGYKTVETKVVLDKDVKQSFSLQPAVYLGDEVLVKAWRAGKNTPVSYTNISREELEKSDLGQDMPTLLSLSPSLVTTSDAGTGIGYSSFRVRGSDLTRINVMVNGVPLNDAESHGVWWVDLPDFAGSIENAQLQRGVGTSANGAAAFGASLNLQTLSLNEQPYTEINSSAGSFNTWKNNVRFGTGLINNHFAFDGRLSTITSDGFIDRAFSDLKSYYLSGGYYAAHTIVKFVTFSGKERTYQAWNGVPKAKLNNDVAGMETYIMANGLDAQDSANLFNSNPRKYNMYTYSNQTDNYKQDYYQLLLSHTSGDHLSFSAALHYTRGKGYYEEYEKSQSFADYGLPDLFIGSDSVIHYVLGLPVGYYENGVIQKTDLIRQKWLDNGFYGIVGSVNYSKGKSDWSLGTALNRYDGHHFGYIIWNRVAGSVPMNYEWYRSKAEKNDFNIFLRNTTHLTDNLSIYADLQYRHIYYTLNGIDDKLRNITQTHLFDFFNPKLGIQYALSERQSLGLTWGVGHREPSRSNYVDEDPNKPAPVDEQLQNAELSYQLSMPNFRLGIDFYYMYYHNQLVLTGEINDVGDPVMTNAKESYRAGIEMLAEWNILPGLRLNANAALSRNKILHFTEYVDNWDYWNDPVNQSPQLANYIGLTDLSFSPAFLAGGQLEYSPFKGFSASIQSKYVGKQYIDNTSSSDRMLDAYFVNNLLMNYSFPMKWIKQVKLELMVNNLFNAMYSSNAWVYRFYYEGKYQSIDGYFPQAGINFLFGIQLSF